MPQNEARSGLPIVVLSTADINAPVWTNKQHIATRLSAEREVHYIESLGLRSPSLNIKDIGRLIDRLKSLLTKNTVDSVPRRAGDGRMPLSLHIHAPLVIPFHKFRVVRSINRRLIKRKLLPALPPRYILWTFSPLTYGLESAAEKVIYHSVDLLHKIEGVPEKALVKAEEVLISRSHAVVASSNGVASHLKTQGARPLIWENVADIELFNAARLPIDNRERRAIFAGNLTPSKIDFELMHQIVSRGCKIALAGPVSIDGTNGGDALQTLLQSPHVTYLGVLDQREMAFELGKSWVGIIPYLVNDYTTGVFPMKVYEYLSSGLPVISSPLPSLLGREIANVTLASGIAFVDDVCDLLSRDFMAASGDLGANSWEARLRQVRGLIDTETTPREQASEV